MTELRVAVDVATAWTSPDAPRDIDRFATADRPNVEAWSGSMSPDERMGLHGRTLTQLLAGEPVVVIEEAGDWARVAARWQPAPDDPRGYIAWVRRAHLTELTGDEPAMPVAAFTADRAAICGFAGSFLGLRYLWGGTSEWGLDCSGLVHYSYRQAGVVVPRDASAQAAAADVVPLGQEVPGDLYFFARPDGRVFHVGFVTGRQRMLHAPEGGGRIEDVPLAPERKAALACAGRLLAG